MRQRISITVLSALVHNDRGEILMVQRHEPELPEAHNKWELPAGKAHDGEDRAQAAEREVFEETGYRVQALQALPKSFVSEWNYPDFDQHTTIICYLARLLSEEQVAVNDHHVSEIRWIDPDTAQNYPLLPGVLFFIQQSNERP